MKQSKSMEISAMEMYSYVSFSSDENDFGQPILALFFLFVSSSQSWSGLKYSNKADADIFDCPVNVCNASGHVFDAPNASISLQKWNRKMLEKPDTKAHRSTGLLQCISGCCTIINIAIGECFVRIAWLIFTSFDAQALLNLELKNS